MARNASGTHSLPSGNPVVSGTSISSTVQNATASDISTELTDSLSRSGKGAMLAPLRLTNGTAGAPAATFDSDTDTGLYRIGANNLGVAVGGAKVADIGAAGLAVTGALSATTTLAVTGAATLSSTLTVTGAATFTGGITAPSMTTLSAPTNWTAGTGNDAPRYWKSNGMVCFIGTLTSTANTNTSLFPASTMPAGYRPLTDRSVCGMVISDASAGSATSVKPAFVTADGAVHVSFSADTGDIVHLNGLCYRAEQ